MTKADDPGQQLFLKLPFQLEGKGKHLHVGVFTLRCLEKGLSLSVVVKGEDAKPFS